MHRVNTISGHVVGAASLTAIPVFSHAGAAPIKLNDGTTMPSLAFGFWELPGARCADCLENAIDAGYRCLDFATVYGNEADIGPALEKIIASGKVKRKDLYIIGKLWATDWHQVDAACAKSLEDLRLDYFDLYLVHSPVGIDVSAGKDEHGRVIRPKIAMGSLWQKMESLVADGKTKSIGVSNWSTLQLADAMNYSKIPPAVNQLEVHPTYGSGAIGQWCLSLGIAVMGYCTLGTSKPDMTLDVVTKAAKRLGKSNPQVLVKWSLQKGYIPITKGLTPDQLQQNLAMDFRLSDEEMKALDACDGGLAMKVVNHAGEFGLPLYN